MEKRSVIWIAPMSAPATPASFAIAPTMSFGRTPLDRPRPM